MNAVLSSRVIELYRDVKFVVPGDYNNDGKTDLAVSFFTSRRIAILNGNGTGLYPTVTYYNADSSVVGLVKSDFNNDGHTDLATLNAEDNTISVLVGSASGTFSIVNFSLTSGTTPVSFVTGDFNGDGKTDIVTACSQSLEVLLGTGTASFLPVNNYTTNVIPNKITCADFNGDGKQDLAMSGIINSDMCFSIFEGSGTGSFTEVSTATVTNGGGNVVSADFNQDGKIDIAMGGGNVVHVFMGNGTSFFSLPTDYSVQYCYTLFAEDVNGDNVPDLGVTEFSNGIKLLLNSGTGTFTNTQSYYTRHSSCIAKADVNNDNVPDLIIGGVLFSQELTILLGNVGGRYTGIKQFDAPGAGYSLISKDFNNDGKTDLAYSNTGKIEIVFGLGNGDFTAPVTYTCGWSDMTALFSADFNNDGHPDLLARRSQIDTVKIFLGSSQGTFALTSTVSISSAPSGMSLADFNGDNKIDIAAYDTNLNGIRIFKGNGNGTFSLLSTLPSVQGLIAGDFNQDGVIDLLSGGQSMKYYKGLGGATFAAPTTFMPGLPSIIYAVADLNGDAKSDLVVFHGVSGSFSTEILLGVEGGAFVSTGSNLSYTAQPMYVQVADFNGDMKPDLVLSAGGGPDEHLYMFAGMGNGTVANPVIYESNSKVICAADFNSDNLMDMAAVYYNEKVGIILNNGQASVSIAAPAGTVCEGTAVTLTANGSSIYNWNTGDVGPSIIVTPTSNTVYEVISYPANGCSANKQVTVNVFPFTQATLSTATNSVCFQSGTYTLQGTLLGGYYSGLGVNGNIFSPIVVGSDTLIYTYLDANNCHHSTKAIINVDECTGVNETNLNVPQVLIYPNPTDKDITIECIDDSDVMIYTSLGTLVLNEKLKAGKNLIPTFTWNNGIYLIKIICESSNRTTRIIKN